MRVLIVDDEGEVRQRIRQLIQAEGDADVVGECANGADAVKVITRDTPDVICLAVQMSELDGFGVLRQLPDNVTPHVLFVSACDGHALRAFDVNAVDYIVKPLEAERFRMAFARVRRAHQHAAAASQLGELLETVQRVTNGSAAPRVTTMSEAIEPRARAADTVAQYASRVLVKQEGRMFFVKVADIDWVEADRNYVRLHVGDAAHTIRERISRLEETLDPAMFARIHRSTVINLNRVREMQQWCSGDYVVLLENGTRLRLSRHYRDRVEQRIRVG